MRSRKRNNWKLILVVILLTISLGYAFLQTDLTINGTSKINATSWDIHFEDLTPNPNSVTLSTGDVAPTIDSTTRTDITYTITLKEPGDFYEFEVAVVNGGTLDAMIGTITNKLNGNEISTTNPLPAYLSYTVTYSDNIPIALNQLLEAGNSETIKVRLAFRTDIDPSDLPTEGATNTLSFGLSYVQADENAVQDFHPIVVYTANIYEYDSAANRKIRVGDPIPNAITQYSIATEAIEALNQQRLILDPGSTVYLPYALKHEVLEGIVTASYVVFVITPEMALANPTRTPGTYSLRAYDWDNYTDEMYDSNKSILQSAFGVDDCVLGTHSGHTLEEWNYYRCGRSENLCAGAYSDASVNVWYMGQTIFCDVLSYTTGIESYCGYSTD